MKPSLDTALVISASAFAALISTPKTASNNPAQPVTPVSAMHVHAGSIQEVSAVSALAQRYGYRTCIHTAAADGMWVLRMFASVGSGGSSSSYAPSVPPLETCPGFYQRRLPSVSSIVASSQVISERVARWWRI